MDMTEILNELLARLAAERETCLEERCKHRFSIFPIQLKKFQDGRFDHYNYSWLSKIYIFQKKFSGGENWHTMAILDKNRAIEYLLER